MLILKPNDILYASVSANSSVFISIYGQVVEGKPLCLVNKQLSTNIQPIYSCVPNQTIVCNLIIFSNCEVTAKKVSLWHDVSTTKPSPEQAVFSDFIIPANSIAVWNQGGMVILNAADVLFASASADSSITVSIYGNVAGTPLSVLPGRSPDLKLAGKELSNEIQKIYAAPANQIIACSTIIMTNVTDTEQYISLWQGPDDIKLSDNHVIISELKIPARNTLALGKSKISVFPVQSGAMAIHGNEYHEPDFTPEELAVAYAIVL
jgi:hypothetical protein